MREYVIFTDSTADLTPDLVAELNLTVISLDFTIDGKTYKDDPNNPDMNSSRFYDLLRRGILSKTTQINANTFADYWDEYLKQGKDILYISFSSGLSGTYQSACIAADDMREKYPERKITVVDTLAASLGEGLLVYYAAKQRDEGKSIDEVAAWLEENKLKICHWFTVDDLNHLKRGGRVSSTAALIGSILGIKPVLHVDDEGHLIPVTKVRGRKQSLDALVDRMKATCVNPEEQMVFISHGDSLKDAEYVADEVRRRMKVKGVKIGIVGPVIGSHSGPGTMALFFMAENRHPR